MLIKFSNEIIEKIKRTTKSATEHFGKLAGKISDNLIEINNFTMSNDNDFLQPTNFKETSSHHYQRMLDYRRNNQDFFIGTWHSHRIFFTNASLLDKKEFKKNYYNTLFNYSVNIIINHNTINIYVIGKDIFISKKISYEELYKSKLMIEIK